MKTTDEKPGIVDLIALKIPPYCTKDLGFIKHLYGDDKCLVYNFLTKQDSIMNIDNLNKLKLN